MANAYEIAKSGGRHAGLYDRFRDARIAEIEKSIRSYEKRIIEHQDKIANPDGYLDVTCVPAHRRDLIERYWPGEIADYREKIEVMRGIIAERTDEKK